ncbi:putative uncharacterized protein [Rhodococcus sp. AW25M09]|uniref:amidohydrolase family protein n=1 Tax=Rhodococcus sp. AW25M09 TaxID=1268303 RepID=UPI0002ABCA6B|nr:amidohydrolase family protein [Rhodococcus sp. AW25M09]CCQ17524.1 putative uncharacterized protein [Rhodococcus sp. AW25M09]
MVGRVVGRHGVTAIFEAVIAHESTVQAVAALDTAGELHCHYEGAVRFRTAEDLPDAIETVQRYQNRYGSDRVRIRTLKLFLDGTNEVGNSALLAPQGRACSHGDGGMQMSTDELTQCLLTSNRADVDVHIHMVGDRAFRAGCDAVQAAKELTVAESDTWRIQVTFAHCELVDPADMHRPAELGVLINWTTHWSGGYFGEEAKEHLGEECWNRMYAFNEMIDSGATVAYSSDVVTDYELNRANPFFGIQVAHTRVDPEYPLDADRFPGSVRPAAESVLSLEQLIEGYTTGAAKQLRIDDRAGSIEVGKAANLVVLDTDLFTAPPSTISDILPEAVLFDGSVVFGAL